MGTPDEIAVTFGSNLERSSGGAQLGSGKVSRFHSRARADAYGDRITALDGSKSVETAVLEEYCSDE